MKLSRLVRAESIFLKLRATDKWHGIDELVRVRDRQSLLADADRVREDVIARDSLARVKTVPDILRILEGA